MFNKSDLLAHVDKIIATVLYLEVERRLGKTRHGSLLGLAWNGFCVILKLFNKNRGSETPGMIPTVEKKEISK